MTNDGEHGDAHTPDSEGVGRPQQDAKPGRTVDRTSSAATTWYERAWVIVPALVALYPLGFWLAMRRRAPVWRKAIECVLGLAAFALFALILLKPYWQWDGSMTRFWLDFSGGSRLSAKVEEHRAAQRSREASPPPPSPAFASLSWPHFRGPNRDGVVPDGIIETDWKAHPPRELWRQPAGEGYASFSVGGGRAYTIEQRYGNEVVVCYDVATGRELWAHAYPGHFRESLGGDGPRATPTLHGTFVYSLGAEGDLRCLTAADGKLVWKRQILDEFGAQNLQWAMSASPLVEGAKVIVTNSGTPGPSIIAFDARSGETVWQTDAGQQSYSSPVPAELAGRRQLLNLAGRHLNGIDFETGKVLWQFPFATSILISVANPLVLPGDRVFISAGYGTGCAMIKVKETEGAWSAEALWSNVKMKNKFSTSVIVDGHVYGLDEDVLACLDADTGERKWKGGRYGYGSVLAVGGHLLVLSENGTLALVNASPAGHEEVASLRIIKDDKVWNNHVLVGGILLARNHREMVCYDLRPTSQAEVSADGRR